MGVGGQRYAPAALSLGINVAGWAPGPVCTGVESLNPIGFRPQLHDTLSSLDDYCAFFKSKYECLCFPFPSLPLVTNLSFLSCSFVFRHIFQVFCKTATHSYGSNEKLVQSSRLFFSI